MSETQITEFASRPQVVRRFLHPYRAWLSARLGCPMEEAVLLEVDFRVAQITIDQLFPGVPLSGNRLSVTRELRKRVESIELPPGSLSMFQVHETRTPYSRVTSRRRVFEADWQDSLAVVGLRGFPARFIIASIPISPSSGPGASDSCDCVIVRREHAAAFLGLLRRLGTRGESPSLHVHGNGRRSIRRSGWNDLVLSESVSNLVRRDFEMFLEREQWFRDRGLPFRRGYLFHGPPGNGKTSVIRAMLHGGKLDGHTIALFHERTDDIHMERVFQIAASSAPSLIVLEDIDRAFSRVATASPPSRVSLPQLLNCLDGVGTQDGVVVVATANDPSVLDPAILERPGRFDRVVFFPAPDRALRQNYLEKLCSHLDIAELDDSVADSDGLSFAQLREVYILAGQSAYEQNREITGQDLTDGVYTLRRGLASVTGRKPGLGFVVRPDAVVVGEGAAGVAEQ